MTPIFLIKIQVCDDFYQSQLRCVDFRLLESSNGFFFKYIWARGWTKSFFLHKTDPCDDFYQSQLQGANFTLLNLEKEWFYEYIWAWILGNNATFSWKIKHVMTFINPNFRVRILPFLTWKRNDFTNISGPGF